MTATLTRDEQILSLRPQVEYHAHRLARGYPSMYEDFCSEGWIGAIQATDAFRADRGVLLRTFADRRIRGAMVDSIRRQSETKRAVDVTIVPLEKIDLIRGAHDGGMRQVRSRITLAWLMAGAVLSPQQQQVIRLLYGVSEPSMRQAGRKLGKSGPCIYQLKDRALANLRRAA